MNLRLAAPLRLLVVAATAVAALSGLQEPAQADIYDGGGSFGYYSQADATCQSRIYARSKVVNLIAPPPRVWAHNRRAGAGNDWAWIRYRAFVVDASTGATVTSTGWSGWSKATDTRSAAWSGAASFSLAGEGNYRVDHRIEYWNATRRTAWVADRITRYRGVDTFNRQRGLWGSCSYVP